MKNTILFLVGAFLISGCATVASYDPADSSPEGVKVNIGSNKNSHVGDKIEVMDQVCTVSGRGGNRCRIIAVGSMTVVRVEEAYSIAKPDGDITLKPGHVFKLVCNSESDQLSK